jgi:glycosyltransferase involved in cell wall biosynthesis
MSKQKLIYSLIFIIYLLNFSNSNYIAMEENMEKVFREYLTFSFEGKLLPKRKMELSSKPKISLVIPMYNEQKNIKKVIRSIQNQNLQDIEIVCVNDNSNDKTLEILKELQKEDPRITILTNRQNRGVIYNRIYGAIRSKGEYVTFIDADDALCNINILEKAYKVATKEHNEKIDIVHYQTCGCLVDENGKMDKFAIFFTFNPNTFNQVIRAPYIGDNYFQNKKDVTGSGFVFDKIYSRELIIRAANYIGPDVWNQNLVYIDDLLLCFAAMKNAKTIVSINDIGYWHFFDKKTSVTSGVWEIEGNRLKYPAKTNKKIGDFITIVERILKLTENEPQSGELREFILKQIGSDEYMPTIARSVHYEKYIFLTEQAYKWKYNNKSAKDRIKKFFNYLLSFEIEEKDKFAYLFEKNTKKKSEK